MSLRAELADPAKIGHTEWLLAKFNDVFEKYVEFEDRTEAAETLSLWTQRFIRAIQQSTEPAQLPQTQYEEISKLMFMMVDRWSTGNPSYILALRKAMQGLLWVCETVSTENIDTLVPQLAHYAAEYARDDPRIAFGSLESMARSSAANCTRVKQALPESFVKDAFKALVSESSRSGMIGRCLVIILGTNDSPASWFEYVEPFICENEYYQAIMTYFVEPMLKQNRSSHKIFAEFYELCRPHSTASVEIGVLKAARNAKLDVSDQIQSSKAVVEGLSSLSRNIRYDALQLLCGATRKLTNPVPAAVFDAIIENGASLFAEGEPKSRAEVYSAFRNLIIRIKTSKSQETAAKFFEYVANWCAQSLLPGMPYRCLATATHLLELFVRYEMKDYVFTKEVVGGLINCVTSDFADVRESCVILLGHVHELPQVDSQFDGLTEHAFRLLQGGRTGDTGARLLEFLDSRRPDADMGSKVAQKLEALIDIADKDLDLASRGPSIYGLINALRTASPQTYDIMPLMVRIWKLCSPPLMSNAPEGAADEILNFCWKAVKESSLLVESLINSKRLVPQNEKLGSVPIDDLLENLAGLLTNITHWGAFSAVPPAFIAIGSLKPTKVNELAWSQINALSSRKKFKSVTRRSAGLPLLISSCLTIQFDDKIVDALFDLATLPFAEGELEELEMPQVHGMNCLKTVLTDAEISKPTSPFIERALELSLSRFRSPVWSLRNCAAMMFSSLFKRLFGVRGLPVPASVFFQRFRKLQPLISRQLEVTTKASDLQAVYPALAILAKLQTLSKNDLSLAEYWPPVIELLGSPSWKIREIAAKAIASMTHVDLVDEVVYEFARSLSLKDQNQMHGYALAMNELLKLKNAVVSSLPNLGELTLEDTESISKHCSYSMAILEAIIKKNTCMETQVELFKAWKKLGGRERLIAFDDLPQPKFLNPSVDTFESEQVQVSPEPVERYARRWPQVLRNLPADQWTLELAKTVLNDTTQLPDLRAQCIQTLLDSELMTAELSESSLLALLAVEQPSCVRQAALRLIARSTSLTPGSNLFNLWIREVVAFSEDEAPVESRRSAVQSIQTFLERQYPQDVLHDELLYILNRLLSDEEEPIREIAAATASRFLQFKSLQSPEVCETNLLAKISPAYLTSRLAANLVEDCQKARASFDNPNDTIFLVEKESLYRDEVRYIRNQARFCQPDERSDRIAHKAAKHLENLYFESPLQAGASSSLVEARARVKALLIN